MSGAYPKPDEVDQKLWDAFVKHRKTKKAEITELVMSGIAREVEAAGWTLSDALRETIERNWQSFKAEWTTGGKASSTGHRANQGFVAT